MVSGSGEGNTIAGFRVMRRVFGGSPYGGGKGVYGQGVGPYGEHLATGGAADNDDPGVPIVAAGGEYVIAPHEVVRVGDGDMEAGHRVLDDFVKQSRAEIVNTMKNLPGPRRD